MVLQYSSAFDDEVAELPEEAEDEGPQPPEGMESLLEEEVAEGPTADSDQEPLEEKEVIPADHRVEGGHSKGPVAHVPYYYFYQGDAHKPSLRVSQVISSSVLKQRLT